MMNNIQNYGVSNISSNYQQAKFNKVKHTINFKALHMPPKDVFEKFGQVIEKFYEKSLVNEGIEELERIRPTLEKIARENPEVECFIDPRPIDAYELNLAAKCYEGFCHWRLNLKEEMEEAKSNFKSFGEHIADTLKDAIQAAQHGAV